MVAAKVVAKGVGMRNCPGLAAAAAAGFAGPGPG